MAKMRATVGASDFGANAWCERAVLNELNCILAGGGVKGGPATTRMEFSFRFKELIAAGLTTIGANGLGIGVFAGEGAFGCRFA